MLFKTEHSSRLRDYRKYKLKIQQSGAILRPKSE